MKIFQPNLSQPQKRQKMPLRGVYSKQNVFNTGVVALVAAESGFITSKQLISIHILCSRLLKKRGHITINLLASHPKTSRSIGIRMGRGKGSIQTWVVRARMGKVLFSLNGVSLDVGIKLLSYIAKRIPLCSRVVRKVTTFLPF